MTREMKIDTRYRDDQMIVKMRLETDDEKALAPDLLARVGANQHRLRWNGSPGHAELKADPATFRLPASHRTYRVSRRGHTATVNYSIRDT